MTTLILFFILASVASSTLFVSASILGARVNNTEMAFAAPSEELAGEKHANIYLASAAAQATA